VVAADQAKLHAIGTIRKLPNGQERTGPLGPLEYVSTIQNSEISYWSKRPSGDFIVKDMTGADVLIPGASPTFKGVRSPKLADKLDFFSLMIALFAGTASLPHILIRYYTVKDGNAARKSTVVGIASIGFFYVLTLFLGLAAMTSLPPTIDSNMAAPLLARQFGEFLFAVISAIAFTTVLGTVSGLILAASGAVAHDLMHSVMKMDMDDHQKVAAGKIAAVVVGIIAMALGIVFKDFNASFLVGWAFNVAASANLPALVMLLFWSRTTKQGITAAIVVGLIASLVWLALTGPAYQNVYRLDPKLAPMPFSQPAIVTIPLGFLVLIVVSLLTSKRETPPAEREPTADLATAAA
jgi:cation/acetate symporter